MTDQPWTEELIRVRYGETDQMGHAYYGSYALWLEQARGAWCRDRGFTYKQLEAMGWKLPVVELWTKFKGEIKYDDLVSIKIKLADKRRVSLRFEYEVLNTETGRLCTEAYTTHVFVSQDMKAASPPPEVIALVDRDPADWERI
jgi:acyl-CoA thioester hydrolase